MNPFSRTLLKSVVLLLLSAALLLMAGVGPIPQVEAICHDCDGDDCEYDVEEGFDGCLIWQGQCFPVGNYCVSG